MKPLFSMLVLLFTAPMLCLSQSKENLAEKPGTFEILGRTDYTSAECGFSKAEMAANLGRIKDIVGVARENPVLKDIKGFNGRARIYNMSMTCKGKNFYGVPARISFEFSSFFFRKDGSVGYNTIEPPSWSLYTNDIFPLTLDVFNMRDNYFAVPLKKQTISPGIDVYEGAFWVLYDPSRPDYWIPVTVEEAFASVREDMKNIKDEIELKYFKEMFDKEYAAMPEADMKKRAYFGGNLSRVSSTPGYGGQDSLFPYIMKVNPAYWNKSLPRQAVQFIWFEWCQARQCRLNAKSDLEACIKREFGSGCDLLRFDNSFGVADIKRLARQIGK